MCDQPFNAADACAVGVSIMKYDSANPRGIRKHNTVLLYGTGMRDLAWRESAADDWAFLASLKNFSEAELNKEFL